jgi:hypothetical protein
LTVLKTKEVDWNGESGKAGSCAQSVFVKEGAPDTDCCAARDEKVKGYPQPAVDVLTLQAPK